MRNKITIPVLVLLSWLLPVSGAAQTSYQPDPAEIKTRVAEVLRFYQLDSKASPQEATQLAEFLLKIETTTVTMNDRLPVAMELYRLLFRLHGVATPAPMILNNYARSTTGFIGSFVTSGPLRPLDTATSPWAYLAQVEKRGRGPIPMILIAPPGYDWTIYRTFMERNAERYTMYAVTLPGSANSPLPALPKTFDPQATPWWDSAKQGVLNLIEKHKLNKPVIVGLQSSAYLSARLALEHADKVRAAVMICGLAHMPQPSEADPDRPMTLEERRQSINLRVAAMAVDLWPRQVFASREGGEKLWQTFLRFFQPGLSRHAERNHELFLMGALDSSIRAVHYTNELTLTDLAPAMAKLTVPLLAITADHDDASGSQGTPDTTQWMEVKLRYPTIPLTISRFENSRTFVTEDAPEDLDAALATFLTGKPVEIKRQRAMAARPSPRAEVRQQIGSAEIVIAYGRPQVKGREVWGKLVPWNRVWRAGENEATTITLTRDVLIDGQPLAAGTYSLFAIPRESEWTVIFNRVSHQWGESNYNPEFDALRVPVKSQQAELMEWLMYSFSPMSEDSAMLQLRWEKLRLSLKLESVAPAKPEAK